MYLNAFASDLGPYDLTATQEFESLLRSANEMGMSYSLPVAFRSRNAVINGLRFHFLEWGEPSDPPLVLLHGGNQTAHSWDLVSLHLADRFHIIALDQRGHGDSEWPRDCEASFSQMADDAARLIDHLRLRDPVLIGHSMGGLVALKLLTKYPQLVSKTVIVDVGPEVSPVGTRVIGNFVRSAGEYDSIDEFVERVQRHDPYRPKSHIERTARYNLLRRADGKFVSKHDTRHRHIEALRKAGRADWPKLSEVTSVDVPLLLVRGGDSTVLTEELALEFVSQIERGELKTVERAGHNVHSQNTLGFLEVVTPFISNHVATTTR